MAFSFPQFIEREPRIVGPFSFKQFIFIGVAGAVCLFLYYTVPFTTFIILAIFLLAGAFALAFLKIEKIPLPVFIRNLIFFLLRPKIYLWKKKIVPPKIFQEIKEDKTKSVLKIAGKSRLKQLFSRLEIKHK